MHIWFRLHCLFFFFGLTKKHYGSELGEVNGRLRLCFLVYVPLVRLLLPVNGYFLLL